MNESYTRLSKVGLWKLLATASLVLLAVLPVSARAYSYSGYRWSNNVNYVRYDASVPSSWQSSNALSNGRRVWNEAGSPFRLNYSSSSGNVVRAGYYGDTGWLGLTRIWTDGAGRIAKAETKFNRTYHWSTSGAAGYYDVQSVAAHEFGHWLQLKHSYYPTTMYTSAGKGETYMRSLHSDDIAGINQAY